MALDNLRAFIGAIDDLGDLVRVERPVCVAKEVTEIADRCMKSAGGGPALLFTQPTLTSGGRSRYPVAINLFGSERRMALALGVDCLDHVVARISELVALKVPEGLLGKLAMLPRLAEVAKFPPRMVGGRVACQETVVQGADVDLAQFPVPICWPEDGGPYITLGGVITKDPVSGARNVGMYRVQVLGKNELAMHWQRHKVGAAHWRAMAERGETMPVAIALGGDPASIYAASAPLPPTIDEFLFAGFLRGEPVRLAKAVTSDLEVPAEGIFHNLVFVSIDKQYPGQAYKVMNGLWGQGLMSLAKVIVVVDKDVNVRDTKEAWWVALNHIDPERDVRFTMGPIDVLDHSSRGFTFGSKMGIDATRKWKEEGFTREWPNRIVMDPETKQKIDAMWGELGIDLGSNGR